MTDDRSQPWWQRLRSERRPDLGFHAVSAQQRGNLRGIDQHVFVVLVVTSPGSVGVSDEGSDVADEYFRSRRREPRDDRPVLADIGIVRAGSTGDAPLQVAEVKREHAARTQRFSNSDQRAVDRLSGRQVVQRVADRDDRIGRRERIIGQGEQPQIRCRCGRRLAKEIPGDFKHSGRRVGGYNLMPGREQLLGEQAGAAAEFEHQSLLCAHRSEDVQDPPSARGGVEPEALVMNHREITPVKSVRITHPDMLAQDERRRNRDMTQDDLIEFARGLPGVVVQTAHEGDGSPEVAWGDSFFFYDPDDSPEDRRMPFTTIVTKNYDGFDEASDLNRPGVFRLNISVGRAAFEELIGYPPADHTEQVDQPDYTAIDQLTPHPIYAPQAWVSIINPGTRTSDLARSLITNAHAKAADRHRRRREAAG